MTEDDMRTEVSRHANRVAFTVICRDEAQAQKTLGVVEEMLADEGSARLRVTFVNVRIVP